ncbi:hypothetical protein AB0M97_03605 [Streptomyces sp. NPDC051207]|uniref:hypothetical protein n=1 Tax=Streptomyces sp. NPDC051207 TaxID=3154641 RepID=UPI003446588C
MSAPTHTRPHPASPVGADSRLPWWALALPTLSFVALLALILHPSDAHAGAGGPAVTQVLDHLRHLIMR